MIWVVGIVALILGLVLGAAGGVYYLRKQMGNMQMSDADIAQMARSMGVNLSQKQLAQVSRKMKSNQGAKPGAKAGAKKRK